MPAIMRESASGLDGNLSFTLSVKDAIGRLTPTDDSTELALSAGRTSTHFVLPYRKQAWSPEHR